MTPDVLGCSRHAGDAAQQFGAQRSWISQPALAET